MARALTLHAQGVGVSARQICNEFTRRAHPFTMHPETAQTTIPKEVGLRANELAQARAAEAHPRWRQQIGVDCKLRSERQQGHLSAPE